METELDKELLFNVVVLVIGSIKALMYIDFIKVCKRQPNIGYIWNAVTALMIFNMAVLLCLFITAMLKVFLHEEKILIIYSYFNAMVIFINLVFLAFVLDQVNRVINYTTTFEKIGDQHLILSNTTHQEERILVNESNTISLKRSLLRRSFHYMLTLALFIVTLAFVIKQLNQIGTMDSYVVQSLLLFCFPSIGVTIYETTLFGINLVLKHTKNRQNQAMYKRLRNTGETTSHDKVRIEKKAIQIGFAVVVFIIIWVILFNLTVISYPYSLNIYVFLQKAYIYPGIFSILLPSLFVMLVADLTVENAKSNFNNIKICRLKVEA